MKCRTLDSWHGSLTGRRQTSQFSSTWTNTRQILERELRYVGARNAVLELSADQTDMRNDGWPYANARVEPPIRLSFDSKHGVLAYQCDRFTTWQDNVRAVALALEALRKVDRYGISDGGEQYTGWKQIEQTTSSHSATDMLADLADIPRQEARAMDRKALIRSAKRKTHPDTGGSVERFRQVMELAR